jgi:hypothetical protein
MSLTPALKPASLVRKRRIDRDLVVRWIRNVAIAAVVGLVLGQQITDTQPRIMKAIIGMAVLYAAWKFPIPVSLSAFLLLFPFPFTITYGSSNTIFVFLIAAMWLIQIVLRTERRVGHTMLDLPIILLIGAYLVSFTGVSHSSILVGGLVNFSTVVAGVFVYYLIVHSVRDEHYLRRMVNILTITASLTFIVALYELLAPGKPFIKGWILSSTHYNPDTIKSGLRVGGPFGDFELYAEYCAMMFPLFLFHLLRATGKPRRFFWGGLTFLCFFVLMSTVTRGATISLFVSMIYLLFRLRKQLSMRQMLFTVTIAIIGVYSLDTFLASHTVSGSIIGRLLETKFVNGLPDSRTFWPQIIERIAQKPWFGHGPFYEFGQYGQEKLTRFFWPHNGYLYYLHTIGILGTGAFLWIVIRLWTKSSQQSSSSLWSDDYPRSLLLVWHMMITIFMIDQLKIEYLRNPDYQFFPWIVFGLTVATMNVVKARGAEVVPLRPAPDPVGGAMRFRRRPAGAGASSGAGSR